MISLRSVSKDYDASGRPVSVLKGITLDIARGEMVVLLGPSGTGKTTLLNIIGCLDLPTEGNYEINGQDVRTLSDAALSRLRNRHIGFVFQFFHLLPTLTALENAVVPLLYTHPYPADAEVRARELFRSFGIDDIMHARANTLSGGQQQRVALARALINAPSLLVADEPTGSLDPDSAQEILRIFRQLNDAGMTIVYVTHDPSVAERARRIVRLDDGRIVEDRTAA